MLHQWGFLSRQDRKCLYDEIYVNEPSAIDHRLARSGQTSMPSGRGTVDGECLDTVL